MSVPNTDKDNARRSTARNLAERVDVVSAHAEQLHARMATLPPTFDAKLLFDIEAMCGKMQADLSQITAQLDAGNSFMSGFSLWMSDKNVMRLEQLMDKAKKDAAK